MCTDWPEGTIVSRATFCSCMCVRIYVFTIYNRVNHYAWGTGYKWTTRSRFVLSGSLKCILFIQLYCNTSGQFLFILYNHAENSIIRFLLQYNFILTTVWLYVFHILVRYFCFMTVYFVHFLQCLLNHCEFAHYL